MSELKTLKDLKVEIVRKKPFALCYSEHELKFEAVKWVKEMGIYGSADYCDGMMDFIMKFFNLKEEDLKNENSIK